jgi:hypothetical protein
MSERESLTARFRGVSESAIRALLVADALLLGIVLGSFVV